ncbi:unnamed protein product, partial [Musa banksii]
MPRLGAAKVKAAAEMPPKGCMAVRVGQEGEEQRRFVVPVAYLDHPLFAELLDTAAQEYGFNQKGPIAIPCGVDHFRHVSDVIHSDQGAAAGHHRHRLRHFAAFDFFFPFFLGAVVHCSELKVETEGNCRGPPR